MKRLIHASKELGEDYIERANSGFKWLEFYPENSNVAMTVCYNNENIDKNYENTICDWKESYEYLRHFQNCRGIHRHRFPRAERPASCQ